MYAISHVYCLLLTCNFICF